MAKRRHIRHVCNIVILETRFYCSLMSNSITCIADGSHSSIFNPEKYYTTAGSFQEQNPTVPSTTHTSSS